MNIVVRFDIDLEPPRMDRKHRQSRSGWSPEATSEARARLAAYVARVGLKRSRTRDAVIEAFLATRGHVSVDELTSTVRRRQPAVGYSTVYRTVKLLVDCGLAAAHAFGDGQTRYERALRTTHHDHLICLACGAIHEFEDEGIERLQAAVAKQLGFEIASHKMELYGRCAACAGAASAGAPSRGGLT